jgi:hypothetical protein
MGGVLRHIECVPFRTSVLDMPSPWGTCRFCLLALLDEVGEYCPACGVIIWGRRLEFIGINICNLEGSEAATDCQ